MTRLSDTKVACESFSLRDTGASRPWLASTINGNFFTVHVHNGLVRRKVILYLLLLQDVHRCKASLILATILLPTDYILSKAPPARYKHRRRTLSTLLQKKRIFLSLCFDTMLYGKSCVCARAAHIDLVLVPCIGTSIDLEFSIRHCLQNENCSLEPITDCGQASEVLQKIKKKV